MYVRTKEGKIFNCFASESMGKPVYYVKNSLTNGFIDYDDVYKASPDIIDIVQVGDYVNGLRAVDVFEDEIVIEMFDDRIYLENKDIKSIVTREQFEQMKYEVE